MITRRYNWIVEPKKENSKEANVRFRVKWDKSKNVASFSLGYTVSVDKFANQRCKSNTTHGRDKVPALEINRKIALYESIAEKIFDKFEFLEEIPTIQEFKDEFNKLNGKENLNKEENRLFHCFDIFAKEQSQRNGWTISTHKKYKSLRNHLNEFNPKLRAQDLTEKTLQELQQFYIKKGYRNNYIYKMFGCIKSFIRWLHKKQLYRGDVNELYTPKLKNADRQNKAIVYLEWSELMAIYNLELTGTMAQVRDAFCFCCFTSLRYSDVKKLQTFDIKENHIEVVTQKTNDALKIELNDFSRAILDKYKNVHLKGNSALPVISNQKMNKYLKEIAKLADINKPIRKVYFIGNNRKEEIYEKWELITTHCGRRTFVVNALFLGIPAEVVIKWTGHSDYKAMKPYIEIVDSVRQKEMSKFNAKNVN